MHGIQNRPQLKKSNRSRLRWGSLRGVLADPQKRGEAFLLTVGAFLLTVKLLCLQSLKVLIRCTFSLQAQKLQL